MNAPARVYMQVNRNSAYWDDVPVFDEKRYDDTDMEYIRADLCKPEGKLEQWKQGYVEDKSAKRKSNS